MEDSGDEDIDDLYADVEKLATSAIGAIQALTELSYETEVATEECNYPEVNEGVDCGDGSASTDEKEEGGSNGQLDSTGSGSESEDDFDIVLNDDVADASNNADKNVNFGSENGMNEDENGFDMENRGNCGMVNHLKVGRRGVPSNGGHSPLHKHGRSHSATYSSNMGKSTSVGVLFRSSSLVRGDREDGLFARRSSTRSTLYQNGHDSSSPRSRTIWDANVDAFDHKPWRHPGVDLTDYFNYGLNEDSWKHYYKDLNQKINSQDRAVAAVAVAVAVSEKSTKSKQRTVSHADEIFSGKMSKGRSIQVEDGNGERRPSTDINLPVERDSDAIQIPVQDLEESCQLLGEVPFDRSISCLHESENEVASGNGGDMLRFSGDGEDKSLKIEGLADGTGELLPERCLRETPACDSDPVSLDSDKDSYLMLPDTDERLQLMDSDSDGNPEAMSTFEDPKRIAHDRRAKTVNSQSGKELELSQAKQRHCSHSSASETSKDRVCVGSEEFEDLNSDSEFKGSDKFDRRSWKHSQKSSISSMSVPGDDKRVTRRYVNFHERKHTRISGFKNYLNGESDSRMIGGEFYDKQDATFVRDKEKSRLHDKERSRLHDKERSRLHDEQGSRLHDEQGSRLHDKERSRLHDKERSRLHDKERSRLHDEQGSRLHDKERSRLHDNQRIRLRPSDYYEGKDILHNKVQEYSSNHGEASLFNCLSGSSYDACPRWRGGRDFDIDRDRHQGPIRSGKPEFLEQISGLSGEFMKRKWHQREKEFFIQDMDFLESARLKGLITEQSESLDHRNCMRWERREEEPSFDRRTGALGFLPEHNYSNDFTRDKSIPCDEMVVDHINTKYARHLPYVRRDAKSPVRCERKCENLFNGNETICWADYDERRLGYARDGLSLHAYKEHPVARRARGKPAISSRDRNFERHASPKRWHGLEQSRESNPLGNFCDNFDYEKNIRNADHMDEFASGARYQQSEVLHWTEREYNSRSPRDCPQAYMTPSSFDRTFDHVNSRCDIYDSMHRLSEREKPVNGRGIGSIDCRRYRLPKEDEKCSQFFHNRNVSSREKLEQMLPRCRDSSDSLMFVGYSKSSRCSEAGSLKSYDRSELLDWNDDLGKRNYKHTSKFYQSKIHENDKTRIHAHQDDAKWGRRLPGAQQNDYLEIEEGEVIGEDFIEKPMENVIASEGTPKPFNMKNTPADSIMEREMVAAYGYDNPKIKELLEKMEKRRERFKQPITVKGEAEKAKALANDTSNMEAKLQRPTRKRRWGGS